MTKFHHRATMFEVDKDQGLPVYLALLNWLSRLLLVVGFVTVACTVLNVYKVFYSQSERETTGARGDKNISTEQHPKSGDLAILYTRSRQEKAKEFSKWQESTRHNSDESHLVVACFSARTPFCCLRNQDLTS